MVLIGLLVFLVVISLVGPALTLLDRNEKASYMVEKALHHFFDY